MNRFDAATACPICGTPRPPRWAGAEPWMCSAACYWAYFELHHTAAPSCHDSVTITCPLCQRSFTPVGRQKFCSDACRSAAYRRRRDANRPTTLTVPKTQPRRPITVYECDNCGNRALGEQRCETCSTFMRKIGLGGECPSCGEALAVNELLSQEVIAAD